MKNLASTIDHTLLAPQAGREDVIRLCREAAEHGFYAVCVNSRFVPLARKQLDNTPVKIACVVGFPLGASATEVKVCETVYACREGAREVDMVLSIGALKEGADDQVLHDIAAVVDAAEASGPS